MSKIYEYDDGLVVGEGNVPIKITTGPYKGTVFTYGTVSFSEEGDSVKCNFQYDIIEKSNDLIEDKIFIDQLGEILVDILSEEIQEAEDDFLRSGLPLTNEDS